MHLCKCASIYFPWKSESALKRFNGGRQAESDAVGRRPVCCTSPAKTTRCLDCLFSTNTARCQRLLEREKCASIFSIFTVTGIIKKINHIYIYTHTYINICWLIHSDMTFLNLMRALFFSAASNDRRSEWSSPPAQDGWQPPEVTFQDISRDVLKGFLAHTINGTLKSLFPGISLIHFTDNNEWEWEVDWPIQGVPLLSVHTRASSWSHPLPTGDRSPSCLSSAPPSSASSPLMLKLAKITPDLKKNKKKKPHLTLKILSNFYSISSLSSLPPPSSPPFFR